MNDSLRPQLDRLQQRSLLVGIVALAVCAAGASAHWTEFLHSYLVAFIFWLNVALGCFAICMLQHMIQGKWGLVIRRPLEAGAGTFPLLVIFFLPLAVGHARLYQALPTTDFKGAYLHLPFFYSRAVIYFAIWILFAFLLNKWSAEQDRTGERAIQKRLAGISGPGLLLYGFTITFAAIDWVMSLDPKFFSTIYGMLFIVMPALAAMSFVVIATMLLSRHKPLSDVVKPSHFHDCGNLLLTFVMLWAYLSFAQFLIIWAGNLQDEIPWYTSRARGEWGGLALFLVLFHFAVPFILLLNRPVKKNMRALAGVAVGLLVVSWIDLYWIIQPSFHPDGPRVNWMDFVTPIGLGGIWIAVFIQQLKKKSILPLHDPRFEGVVEHG